MNSSNITNTHGIPLALAVWLLADFYDYSSEANYISATSLMKPLRQIILTSRLGNTPTNKTDLSDFAARALGNALHDSIEKAWLHRKEAALSKLGYPESVIKRILVNPSPEELQAVEDPIPVFIEQRAVKQVGKWRVGGKFDFVADGVLHDNKTTSVYSWINRDKDSDYQLQGSIYRWLHQDKITEDFIRINFIFTDWQKSVAQRDPKYPQARTLCREIPLLSLAETEIWIQNKLFLLEKYQDAPDSQIPECTDEELWRTKPVFKYYADPSKTSGRSTKNFTDKVEASQYMTQRGGAGVLITTPGEPKRCGYCDAFSICQQARRYFP